MPYTIDLSVWPPTVTYERPPPKPKPCVCPNCVPKPRGRNYTQIQRTPYRLKGVKW
jgi:hypothetical protein